MNTPNYKSHISSVFNAELEDVRQRVLAMGGLVEQQIVDATKALTEVDRVLADQVIRNDEKVNTMEVMIDDECSRILARRQPTASDLRLVYAVIKTITDLERMGDEAEKVARMASDLSDQERGMSPLVEVGHLSRHVSQMVRDALDSFARMDAESALACAAEDINIDREYEALMRQCITFMMEDPRTIRRVLDIMWAVRALERVGDHARNICEYVIYFVKGKDVRHISLEAMQREVREEGE
ncbi:MAG: phosphate signaling complex protein PhoU [Phenylobacterium sp.]|uniref:phosphate signaling complex protein PhoU n=1 Tax=Phenylobacterium sp. TaxID=1871053 RepID=UPI00273642D8|nr:phosphate signaling complex protein PhoU [Phenylobacterium sp.]MDP3749212.1 phosphate signaling complex protein PhoU [Phenylobacterium sp.]